MSEKRKKRGPYKRAPGNETTRLSSIIARIITSPYLDKKTKLKAIEALL